MLLWKKSKEMITTVVARSSRRAVVRKQREEKWERKRQLARRMWFLGGSLSTFTVPAEALARRT